MLVITAILVASLGSITAFAATTDPYGYYWRISKVTEKTFAGRVSLKSTDFYTDNKAAFDRGDVVTASAVGHYSYNYSTKGHTDKVEVMYKGNNIYSFSTGKRLRSDLRDEKDEYIGYKNGILYVITTSKELLSFDGATWKYLSSSADILICDADDLVTHIQLTNGTKKEITTLTSTPIVSDNRVEKYREYEVDIFEAFKNGNSYLIVKVDGKDVKVGNYVLSTNCRGAKFVGIDKDYNVYLEDENGSLYKFYYSTWTVAYSGNVYGEVKEFIYNENGFLINVKTTTGTYSLSSIF